MEDQICNATIEFGDDFGDNTTTFHCNLPYGHSGEHKEIGDMYGKRYELKWVDGEIVESTCDSPSFKEK